MGDYDTQERYHYWVWTLACCSAWSADDAGGKEAKAVGSYQGVS